MRCAIWLTKIVEINSVAHSYFASFTDGSAMSACHTALSVYSTVSSASFISFSLYGIEKSFVSPPLTCIDLLFTTCVPSANTGNWCTSPSEKVPLLPTILTSIAATPAGTSKLHSSTTEDCAATLNSCDCCRSILSVATSFTIIATSPFIIFRISDFPCVFISSLFVMVVANEHLSPFLTNLGKLALTVNGIFVCNSSLVMQLLTFLSCAKMNIFHAVNASGAVYSNSTLPSALVVN